MDCVELTKASTNQDPVPAPTQAPSHALADAGQWSMTLPGFDWWPQAASIMCIINVTPDSFSDGGHYTEPTQAIAQMRAAYELGVRVFDIGGESTRPGSQAVSSAEECARVLPVIQAMRALDRELPGVILSIDTSKAAVAEAALAAGADIINDVSAGRDPAMFAVVAQHQAPYIMMHMQGLPENMQDNPQYDDVVAEVSEYFEQRMTAAESAGVQRQSIMLDPGIGFGKTLEQNLLLLQASRLFRQTCQRPLLIGLSRKSYLPLFMGKSLPADKRDTWSHYFHAALADACDVLRVHDCSGVIEALRARAVIEHQEGLPLL